MSRALIQRPNYEFCVFVMFFPMTPNLYFNQSLLKDACFLISKKRNNAGEGSSSGKGSGWNMAHNTRANKVTMTQAQEIRALCLLLLSPSFLSTVLLVGTEDWVAHGVFRQLTQPQQVLPRGPLTPRWPRGGLFGLQLPEREQDEGFDHWPLRPCFLQICNTWTKSSNSLTTRH